MVLLRPCNLIALSYKLTLPDETQDGTRQDSSDLSIGQLPFSPQSCDTEAALTPFSPGRHPP